MINYWPSTMTSSNMTGQYVYPFGFSIPEFRPVSMSAWDWLAFYLAQTPEPPPLGAAPAAVKSSPAQANAQVISQSQRSVVGIHPIRSPPSVAPATHLNT